MRAAVPAVLMLLAAVAAPAVAGPLPVPPWLFPGEGDLPQGPFDAVQPLHLPDSTLTYTEAQLSDEFAVPDWHPDSHPPMPRVVARGRPPQVYACGYCHLANGQGRPENAALAGLPREYLLQQLADFKSGERRVAWPGPNAPSDSMIALAGHLEAADAAQAAGYFARLKLRQRSHVIEGATLPAVKVSGWTYVPTGSGPSERLGERLIEVAPDAQRDARRDDELVYDAYVPAGSLARGRDIAAGKAPGTVPCATCHGADLRGAAVFPPIAGRSASYVLRQLFAFRNGTRRSAAAQAMAPVVEPLAERDLIALAAYV
ncbi:MAG TPA: c-type cytochrome, partial [Steroidobacteraceae bacterium]|nr:c-type cytochrome [Steroidobacteraceae bacterium]